MIHPYAPQKELFSLHSTNGRKQKCRQKALLPRPSDGYRVQNKNASIVSILTFLYGGDEGDRTLYLLNAIQALSQMSYAPGVSPAVFPPALIMIS